MHRYAATMLIAVISVALLAAVSLGQEPVDELSIFRPLIGTGWSGHFQDSWATQADQVIEWKTILNGQVVRWSKQVEELGFSMETYFYWNPGLGSIAFVQLCSNGNHGEGAVETEDHVLALVGISNQASRAVEFRQTFEITADGTLEDRYFSRSGDGWAPQHVIVYSPAQEQSME